MARIVGVDLGSYSVKVVRLEPKGRAGFEVLGYHEVLLAAGEGTLADKQSAALAELKSKGQLDGDVYVTGLPGDAAAVRTLSFPFSDAKKIGEALPFALESEMANAIDLDDIVLSYAVLGPSMKSKRDAVAPHTDVLVAWAKKEAVQAVLDLLAVHGIDPRHVELNALALDDLWDGLFKDSLNPLTREGPSELRTPGGTVIEMGMDAPEPATAIVDIGHRTTSVCVMAGGRVVSAHTILHGGADATRALSKAIGLPLVEAERGKRKEAFIEVAGARAQFPEQAQISEVLKGAYAPVLRRLRQTFQATISQARVRVVKVVVVGGGSRVLNLDRHMAEELNVKVVRGRELAQALKVQQPFDAPAGSYDDGAPEAALAFAYALSAAGSKTRTRIDFRTAEFAWRGDYEFLREKAPQLAAWAAVLVLLLTVSGVARAFVLGSTEDALMKQEMGLCKDITGKQDLTSYSVCMSMIQERIKGQTTFSVPERSAADTYVEVAQRLPAESELHRKITELDITNDRVKMRGLTSSYEAVDKLVERLQGGKCFALVEKGKAQNKGSDIDFNISINLDCAAAQGDGKVPTPPPTGRPMGSASSSSSSSLSPMHPPPLSPPRPNLTPTSGPPQNTAPLPAALRPFASPTPPDEGAEVPGNAELKPRTGKLTPEEIEERRDRLRKLREEREQRRAVRPQGDMSPPLLPNNPLVSPRNPALRDRMLRGPLPNPVSPQPPGTVLPPEVDDKKEVE